MIFTYDLSDFSMLCEFYGQKKATEITNLCRFSQKSVLEVK